MKRLLIALGATLMLTHATLTTVHAADAEKDYKHVDAAGAAQLLKETKDVTVLDVRTAEEFKDGHLAKAKNIDFRSKDFAEQIGKLDRNKTYLVHCGSGKRSTDSLPAFKKLGFKSVVHLDGGMSAWQKAGNPVEK